MSGVRGGLVANKNNMQEYTTLLSTQLMTGEDTSFQDFEDYLKERFMEDARTKDDFDDNFDNWIQKLDAQEWIDYSNKFKNS